MQSSSDSFVLLSSPFVCDLTKLMEIKCQRCSHSANKCRTSDTILRSYSDARATITITNTPYAICETPEKGGNSFYFVQHFSDFTVRMLEWDTCVCVWSHVGTHAYKQGHRFVWRIMVVYMINLENQAPSMMLSTLCTLTHFILKTMLVAVFQGVNWSSESWRNMPKVTQ